MNPDGTSTASKISFKDRLSRTLGRPKKSRDHSYTDIADGGVAGAARNGFVNGAEGGGSSRVDSDVYPDVGPLQSGTHSLKRVKPSRQMRYSGHFQEVDNPKRFTLPIFGNLGRSASISQVNRPLSASSAGNSVSKISQSTVDLSSRPLSPHEGKTIFMPEANRRQRRASLSEVGFGKLATYSKLEKLGEGTYATVYKGKSSITGKTVALKEIRLEHEEGAPCTAIREVSLLKELKHANIVTLHDIIHTSHSLTLIFEYVDQDLKQYLDRCCGMMATNNTRLFLFQLLRGLAYCHSRRVLHRDLKPQNLLISENGDLKLADFGLARAKSVPTKTYSNEVVTLWYRPPDVLLGSTVYNGSIDMWGVGCILFEMVNGRPMFPGSNVEEELMLIWKVLGTPNESTWPGITKNKDFLAAAFPHYSCEPLSLHVPRLDSEGLDLMNKLLRFQSDKRMTAAEAMKHNFFKCFGPRIHELSHTMSIFTIPECQLAPNPGQRKPLLSHDSSARERRKSSLY